MTVLKTEDLWQGGERGESRGNTGNLPHQMLAPEGLWLRRACLQNARPVNEDINQSYGPQDWGQIPVVSGHANRVKYHAGHKNPALLIQVPLGAVSRGPGERVTHRLQRTEERWVLFGGSCWASGRRWRWAAGGLRFPPCPDSVACLPCKISANVAYQE